MNYLTDQEEFWAGNFGDEYIERNKSKELLASNLNFFSKALKNANKPKSCIEFGSNVGMSSLGIIISTAISLRSERDNSLEFSTNLTNLL